MNVRLQELNEEFKPIGESSLDNKNRVTLGRKVLNEKTFKGLLINTFQIYVGTSGDILLRPMTSVPSSEMWVYNNKKILKQLKDGLKDAAEGNVKTVSLKDLDKTLDKL